MSNSLRPYGLQPTRLLFPRVRLPWWLSGKESACKAGDPGSIPGSGKSPGEGNGYPRQYSCLENPMDGGASRVIIHGVAKSQRVRVRLIMFIIKGSRVMIKT